MTEIYILKNTNSNKSEFGGLEDLSKTLVLEYLQKNKLDPELSKYMIPIIYEHTKMDFDSVLSSLNFKKISEDDVISLIPFLKNKFAQTGKVKSSENEKNWIMGELRKKAIGNIALKKLAQQLNK